MRSSLRFACLVALAAFAVVPACTCESNGNGNGHGGDGGAGGDAGVQIGSITIDPADVTLDLPSGGPAVSQSFKVTYHGAQADEDVSGNCTYLLADTTLGSMALNTFTSNIDHGGTSVVVAAYTPPSGAAMTTQATLHVRVKGSFTDPSCTGCAAFPPDNAPACAAGAEPQVIYPPDGVLLPPNLNQLEVQYVQGTGDTVFELDFKNAATDVRVLSKCVATVDTRATPSGGCQVDLSPAMWDFIAKSNKGGDPVVVTVRATTDGICASTSKNESKMSVSEQDIEGGVYYWKSTVSASGTGGDIWRKSFGDTLAEEKISPSNATCFGCHFLSREGLRMTVSTDDNDSDDEYGDVRSGDVDVAKKAFIAGGGIFGGANQQPGFQAFNHDHTLYLGSNGNGQQQNVGGTNTTAFFFLFNGDTAAAAAPATVLAGNPGERPTMQDWSANDKSVVFVKPTKAGWSNRKDDAHVFGGSIWTMDYTGGTFGAPVEIIHSNGDNNYYPSYSPDSNFIIYNHVPLQGTVAAIDACANKMCPNDSFSNPKARISILPVGATASIDCELANGSPAAAPVDVSNSWPRWSPFIQTYKGAKLLWVTFSSTRDYGLRVRNHVKVGGVDQVQCYPPDSPMDPGGSHGLPFPGNCQQPQLWMAAINLSAAEVSNPGDPSFPAFWLPFQDINTHNHTAQWTQTVVTTPPPDGGTCIMGGQDCTKAPTNCCSGLLCTGNGTCGIP